MLLCLEQTHLLHGLTASLTIGITDLAIPQLVQGLVDAILGVQEKLSRQVSCLQGKDHILAMAVTCCSRPYPTSCRFKGLGCVEYRVGHAEFQIHRLARLAQGRPTHESSCACDQADLLSPIEQAATPWSHLGRPA